MTQREVRRILAHRQLMKHSTLKVMPADTVMQVADLDSLDFMVIIEGSLTLRVEGKPDRRLEVQDYVYPAPG